MPNPPPPSPVSRSAQPPSRLHAFALKPCLSLLGLLILPIATALTAATWQTEIKPGPADNFTQAAFSLWLDETAPPPVALLVLAPGWNGDGRGAINDRQWQSYAKENRLGLIGLQFQSAETGDKSPYHVANGGSGAALLNAIQQLGASAHRPALTTLPLLVWGHSAGGQFGYGMACHAPGRVIAFAAIKGGYYDSEPASAAWRVPGIFVIGERDEIFRAINITRLFETGRAQGAPWCLAYETGSGHELGKANDVIRPFFAGVLKRYQKKTASNDDSWTGIRSSLVIEKAATTPAPTASSARTVWLPDERAAKAWQTFSTH